MMTISTTQEANTITLAIDGRVDSNTGAELQDKILQSLETASKVVLDFEKVAFISSAGLRALLTGHKTAASRKGSMELTHVSDKVMQVLETVGFAKVLTII